MTCDDVRFLCRSIGGVERWNGCALENEGDCRVGARRRRRAVPRPGMYGPRPSRRASSARVFRFTSVRRHASIDWKHRVDESSRLDPSRRASVGMTARAPFTCVGLLVALSHLSASRRGVSARPGRPFRRDHPRYFSRSVVSCFLIHAHTHYASSCHERAQPLSAALRNTQMIA